MSVQGGVGGKGGCGGASARSFSTMSVRTKNVDGLFYTGNTVELCVGKTFSENGSFAELLEKILS